MFRTSGDVIKQLNNIYGIKFLPKYKNELKERVLSFSKIYIDASYSEETFFNKTILLSKDLEFDQTELKLFSPFFEKKKEELFNSFHPVWFKEKNVKKIYSKKELNKFLSIFIYNQQENITKDIFDKENHFFYEYNLNKILTVAKIYKLEEIEEVVFDNNICQQLLKILNKDFLEVFHDYFTLFCEISGIYEKDVVFKKIVDYIDNEDLYSFNDLLYFSFEAFDCMHQDFDEFDYKLNTEAALIGIYYFSKTRELLLKLNSN